MRAEVSIAEEAKNARKPATVVYEKKTKLDFEQAAVDGQFLSPDGSAVKGDQNIDFDSLIKPKSNFKKELSRDAGAVR